MNRRSSAHIRSRVHSSTSGLTLLELLVVVVVIAILAALLVPAMGYIQTQGRTTKCRGNLKQISHAFQLYQVQYDGWLPVDELYIKPPTDPIKSSWRTFLDPHLNSPFVPGKREGTNEVWKCPSDNGEYVGNSQIFRESHMKISLYKDVTRVPMVTDGKKNYAAPWAICDSQGIDFRHDKGANVLYLSAQVKWVEAPAAEACAQWNKPEMP